MSLWIVLPLGEHQAEELRDAVRLIDRPIGMCIAMFSSTSLYLESLFLHLLAAVMRRDCMVLYFNCAGRRCCFGHSRRRRCGSGRVRAKEAGSHGRTEEGAPYPGTTGWSRLRRLLEPVHFSGSVRRAVSCSGVRWRFAINARVVQSGKARRVPRNPEQDKEDGYTPQHTRSLSCIVSTVTAVTDSLRRLTVSQCHRLGLL